MQISANVQKLLADARPSKVTTTLVVNMSRWSVWRCLLGLKIAALGFRVAGLPITFESEVKDGSTEDQGQ